MQQTQRPSSFLQGEFYLGFEYVFLMALNFSMREALERFAKANARKSGPIVWGHDRSALNGLIERIQGQLRWINERRDEIEAQTEKGKIPPYEFAEGFSGFRTAGIQGGWPYVVLISLTDVMGEDIIGNRESRIRPLLIHLNAQCALIDKGVRDRERIRPSDIPESRRARRRDRDEVATE